MKGVMKLTDTQTMKLIKSTVDATFLKINSVALIDKMKALKDDTYKNTEMLLYNYKVLKEHVEDEVGYYEMMEKRASGSIIRYSKSKALSNEDEMMKLREESYYRSKNDLLRLDKALKKVINKKGYKVIELRYFEKKDNGDTYTFDEIAEILSQSGEYSETLSEKTVRRWRSSLVKEISIYLFGSDAI